jgi:hypothetical protein
MQAHMGVGPAVAVMGSAQLGIALSDDETDVTLADHRHEL